MEESIHQVESEIASKEVQESIEESKIEETVVHEITAYLYGRTAFEAAGGKNCAPMT